MSQDYYGAGGGFTASPFSGSATGSPGGRLKTDLSHSLRPVTIAQLHKATQAHADSEWQLENAELGQITLVAQVVDITKQTTNTNYKLEDSSGAIEARHWSDQNSEDDRKFGHVQSMTYARVLGNLKQYGGKRYINATHIRTCEDPQESFFHQLETATIHLMHLNGPPGSAGQAPGQSHSNAATSARGPGMSAYTASTSTGSSDAYPEYANLPPLERKIIIAILEHPDHDEGGVFIGKIAASVSGTGGGEEMVAKISEALDKLMDAGHIYCTSDEAHFQVSR
ncbi:putative replication factor-a protein [Moniliophthora roreri MCA 2997]|uniref:Replication factor-a protein n=1 Tax=Moniliophthora roreri (strain MCA 2997) TaxID=1381753 RepID=V2XLA7_MONRO|nr:putative replication factor-a protein [Moniliophthora roreri MCA 2997]